ncbi:MAG: murein biosynthesis integral membrane protein MurJ [Phycisphaerae bacterium]|nr:murein biosynthesis integral membrane protein MurJ [Phycisphaerae bacterium]
MPHKDSLEKNTRTVWSITLLSRIAGLGRDAAISRTFGAGGISSAFFFAFLIPNLARRLFGEGALSAAFLPAYSKLLQEDPKRAKALASLTIAKLIIYLGLVVVLGELLLWGLMTWAPQPDGTFGLMMTMLPYMPLVCVVAVLGGILQTHGRFGPTAAAPILLNACMIAATLLFTDVFSSVEKHMMTVGVAVVIAGLLQVAWSLHALRRVDWWTRKTTCGTEDLGVMTRKLIPTIIGLGTMQLNTLLDGLIASYPVIVGSTIFGITYPLDEGANASLNFASRLFQFPLGVFGIAVGTAIFPLLASQASTRDAFGSTVRRGLRLVVFIGLPASAGLMIIRDLLSGVVFQGGLFTSSDTAEVGFILLGYSTAIWAYSMTQVLTRAFYAVDDMKTPVKIAVRMIALNVTLNVILIWTPLGTAGLAWSTAFCAVVQVGILMRLIRKHVDVPADKTVVASWIKTLIASLVMSVGVIFALEFFQLDSNFSWLQSLRVLAVCVGVGIAIFGICAHLLKMEERKWILGGRG